MANRARLVVNRHNRLAIRFHYRSQPFWEGTGIEDSPAARAELAPVCAALSAELEAETFDGRRYLHYFPKGNQAGRFLELLETTTGPALRDYVERWLERKAAEGMRHSTLGTYTTQLHAYIVNTRLDDGTVLGNLRVDELSIRHMIQLRAALLRRLSVNSVRAVMSGGLRAVLRDVRAEELLERDPFANMPPWPRGAEPEPDPFTPAERDQVLAWFERERPHYWPFVAMLFHTGCRPSEAVALTWADVDLEQRRVSITKSRVDGHTGPPKTRGARRTIELAPVLAEILAGVYPLRPDPTAFVFCIRNTAQAIEQHNFARADWATAQRRLKLRAHGLYSTRDTFLSIGVSRGLNPQFLAEFCGTSARMIGRHYARFLPSAGPDQSQALAAMTAPVTVTTRRRLSTVVQNYGDVFSRVFDQAASRAFAEASSRAINLARSRRVKVHWNGLAICS